MLWQLIEHGMEEAQYFPGVGTAGSPYDHAVTGVGDTYLDALDDALEQLREEGGGEVLVEEIERVHRPRRVEEGDWRLRSVHEACEEEYRGLREGTKYPLSPFEKWHEECEIGYYISIRWKEREGR